jgi:Ca2+:H+ antiporter
MRTRYLWFLSLVAVPVAVALHFAGVSSVATFFGAGAAIIPLAALMGRATDALADRLGARLGALLNATFGNAAELILGLVALRHGLLTLVKASLIGSIIGNALLVFGMCCLAGGLRHGRQSFDRAAAALSANLLVLAAIGLVVPSALFPLLGDAAEVRLSAEVSGVLLAAYVLSVVFSLLSEPAEPEPIRGPKAEEPPAWGTWPALGVLVVATAGVAVRSEFLTEAVQHGMRDGGWGVSEAFVGVIFVAVIGNAAEHSTAVVLAWRNKMDVALHIAVGSSLQIALLVTPLLVFASFVLAPRPLDLHFGAAEAVAVIASAVVVALVAADGQSHWMEGVLLLAVYLILALAFWHLPS